jgi:hypothetical protein
MKYGILMAAFAAATLSSSAARAAELPGYELKGFPITRHQVAVIGAAGVQEQSPVPTLMFGGMPASPSQVAILSPRPDLTSASAITVGSQARWNGRRNR